MMRLTLLFVALFCVGAAFCNHRVNIGSFQGVYTSPFGKGFYVCQNENSFQGYADEHLLISGTIQGTVMKGVFHNAGTGVCAEGTVELERTSWGVEGFLVCRGSGKVLPFSETRTSEFRPRDAQCALLSTDADADLEGRWIDEDRLVLDLCFRAPDDDEGDDDDETVQGSLQRIDEQDRVVDEFITGYWSQDGKVFTGTWYEDFKAGAIMMFLRNNGDIDYTRWTGLVKTEGQTFIDGFQANDHVRHQTGTFKAPRRSSTADQCKRYEVLQTFVLRNLHAAGDDDDDAYYFLQTQYFDSRDQVYVKIDEDEIDQESGNSSSALMASLALVGFALLALV